MSDTAWKEALERAVKIKGSQKALGEAIGKTQGYISFLFIHARKPISADLALKVEDATDGKVTRHDLRPDIFGNPSKPTPVIPPTPQERGT